MKTIGLIGGMSWESTIPYYSIINEYIAEKLGGLHSAKIVLFSVDFDEIEKCQSSGNWGKSAEILGDAAKKLEGSGADVILICANTMHKVYHEIQAMVSVPIIHIADATADVLEKNGIRKAGLLGTKYTMAEDFLRSRLESRGLEIIVPGAEDMELVNRVIYKELCLGILKEESRTEFSRIIADLKEKNAQAVILGCTEIANLIRQEDSALPAFDTTLIHAQSAARFALEE